MAVRVGDRRACPPYDRFVRYLSVTESAMTADRRHNSTGRYQFGLKALLLLPVGIAIVGAIGVWVGWGAVLFLAPILLGVVLWRSGRVTVVESFVIVTLLYVLIALLLPAVSTPQGAARRSICGYNLKQVLLALHNYHDVYGSFPPACIVDDEGRPMHSWRVLLLPFLEQQALYDKYCFDEPWNGPNNGALAGVILSVYNCPSDPSSPSSNTSYVLVTGKEAIWFEDRAPALSDIRDGTSSTIAVVEVANSGILWMEPRDLDIKEAMRGVNAPVGMCIRSAHRQGAQVGLADGAVHFLGDEISAKTLRALLTADGEDMPGQEW